MPFSFRRSKKFGPLNLTVSKTGVGGSLSLGPLRVTRSAAGRVTTSIRTGIRGLTYRTSRSTRSRRTRK